MKGFTLVEFLVVISILGIAGGLVLSIFTNSLRGSNKSQIVSLIKQNGQSILEIMDKTIRESDDIVCFNNSTSASTLVVVKGGIYTRYRFIGPTIVANGFLQQDNPMQPSLPDINADITLFKDSVCIDPMSAVNILSDTNTSSGVSLEGASIQKNTRSGFNDNVTIQFMLKPGIQVSQAIASQIDPVTFKTTVQLR